MNRIFFVLTAMAALTPRFAFAHVGAGTTASFAAGFAHPFSGLDHVAVMVAVGLWAAIKGGRAIWLWPMAFVSVMLVGGAVATTGIQLPLVEPTILASVVALGLLVAMAVDLPLPVGAAIIGAFALFHGLDHGREITETISGAQYMAGFAAATASLHLIGVALAIVFARMEAPGLIRAAGAACVGVGLALAAGLV